MNSSELCLAERIHLNGHTSAHCVINASKLLAKELVTCRRTPPNTTSRFVLRRNSLRLCRTTNLCSIFIHFSAICARNPSNPPAFYMVIRKSMANVNSIVKYVKKSSIVDIISLCI